MIFSVFLLLFLFFTISADMVADYGGYIFEVEAENFTAIAKSKDLIIIGNFNVNGKFYFYPILFSYFELSEKIPDISVELEEDYSYFAIILSFTGILTIYALKRFRKQKIDKILPEDLEVVIEMIKANGGIITEKELRKKLGFSKSKISLIIVDLEKRGVVEKFRRGRRKVIFLKNP
ncbi:MAG: hypothetical protein RMH75_06290 [Archaeoglobaceae archaeon]|nr:hypothetical protein [Archaeoglobaceae archaeon]